MGDKLNEVFDIEKGDLEQRIEIATQIPEGYNVIPLKMVKKVEQILALRTEEVEAYLRHIPLQESRSLFPFKDAHIKRHISGPHGLHVAQTFILRSKLTSLLEGLDDLYQDFDFPCMAKRAAHYVIGRDGQGREVVGVYFPPLVEIINGESVALLFDGNHRMALCAVGASSETLLIKGSSVSPPYSPIPWHRNFVDKKPPISERYNNFDPSLFKDFGYVGIDG